MGVIPPHPPSAILELRTKQTWLNYVFIAERHIELRNASEKVKNNGQVTTELVFQLSLLSSLQVETQLNV